MRVICSVSSIMFSSLLRWKGVDLRESSAWDFRSVGIIILTLLLAALILCPVVSAQENAEAEEDGLHTGPVDPAAGAWVQYRGERSVPEQPGPQPC